MSRVGDAWARWVRLLDTREPADSLAACRVVAAATMFVTVAHAWWSGVADLMFVAAKHGGALVAPSKYVDWLGAATPGQVHAILIASLVSSALLGVGLFTRAAAIAAWASFRVFAAANPYSGGSGDDVLGNALLLLCVSGCGRAWSLDARLWKRSRLVPAWPRWLGVLQLACVYGAAGFHKMSISWVPGGPADAVWYSLLNPMWARWPMQWLAPFGWATQLATVGTWLFEIAGPILILAFYYRATRDRPGRVRAWFNRVDFRTKYLAVGFCMHLGIELTMEVGAFFGAMLSLYACCFQWGHAPPDQVADDTSAPAPKSPASGNDATSPVPAR